MRKSRFTEEQIIRVLKVLGRFNDNLPHPWLIVDFENFGDQHAPRHAILGVCVVDANPAASETPMRVAHVRKGRFHVG